MKVYQKGGFKLDDESPNFFLRKISDLFAYESGSCKSALSEPLIYPVSFDEKIKFMNSDRCLGLYDYFLNIKY